jgi:hypothetical protein
MWIIWDGRMLHYGLAGRSQNVLFNLYLIATKIEYKKFNIFYIDPLPDLRPDLETSGYSAFTYMFGFLKFQITTELWCLVVWSSQGLDYFKIPYEYFYLKKTRGVPSHGHFGHHSSARPSVPRLATLWRRELHDLMAARRLCVCLPLIAVAASAVAIEDESSTALWLARLSETNRLNGGAPLPIAVAGDHFTG